MKATNQIRRAYVLVFIVLNSITKINSENSSECSASSQENNGFCKKEKQEIQNHDLEKNKRCPLYLAESSIPGAGMGLYTGVSIKQYESVHEHDLVIPIFDLDFDDNIMFKRYTWQGFMHGINTEAINHIETLSPGIFAIINGHTGLYNVEIDNLVSNKVNWMHRSTDVGSGAFTPYFPVQGYANSDIEAGMELFGNYGDHWFTFEGRREKFKNVPLSTDYEAADAILESFATFLSDNQDFSIISSESMQLFWDFTRDQHIAKPQLYNLLPKNLNQIQQAYELGSAYFTAPKEFIRSIDWLEQNALCIGYLTPGISKIPQAGRGAFSSRSFSKGDLVTSSPVLHECHSFWVNYNIPNEYITSTSTSSTSRTQVLINYCFSNPKLSILLCPYGSQVNLINHDNQNPNVQIRWSTSKYNNAAWISNFTREELCQKKHVELVFDYVAIRDILPNEEITMDYGQIWQDAWNKHVHNFNVSEADKHYIPAFQLNAKEKVIKTTLEQKVAPYPANIITECFIAYEEDQLYDVNSEETDHHVYAYEPYESLNQLHLCNVYKRIKKEASQSQEDDIYEYTVGAKLFRNDIEDDFESIITKVPRDAIRLSDKYYSSDLHLSHAFRHPIVLPDRLVPSNWKDSFFNF